MRAHWTSKLDDIARNQVPFAAAQTANALAKLAADDIRQDFRDKLDVRNQNLLRFFVKGPAVRATKTSLTSRVFVGAPASAKKDRGNILMQQDEDGTNTKRPFSSATLMVPSKDYRQDSRGKPRLWSTFKKDLGLFTKRQMGRGGILSIGRRFRTYLIQAKRGKGAGRVMLFLRTGQGKRNSELLYISKPAVVIPKRVKSRQAVMDRMRKDTARFMAMELSKAIASAKQVRSGGGVASSRLP